MWMVFKCLVGASSYDINRVIIHVIQHDDMQGNAIYYIHSYDPHTHLNCSHIVRFVYPSSHVCMNVCLVGYSYNVSKPNAPINDIWREFAHIVC